MSTTLLPTWNRLWHRFKSFKTEIQKEGNFYPIVGRDTTIGYESIYYLTQEQYDDAVIGGKVRISLKGK